MSQGKFIPELHVKALKWLGMTGMKDDEIAEELGISRGTLYNWREKCPEAKEALAQGKVIADSVVIDSLYQRACGFDYVEVKTVRNQDGEVVKSEEYQKHAVQDTAAMCFWLKNRRPDQWRDRQEHIVDKTIRVKLPKELQRVESPRAITMGEADIIEESS